LDTTILLKTSTGFGSDCLSPSLSLSDLPNSAQGLPNGLRLLRVDDFCVYSVACLLATNAPGFILDTRSPLPAEGGTKSRNNPKKKPDSPLTLFGHAPKRSAGFRDFSFQHRRSKGEKENQ